MGRMKLFDEDDNEDVSKIEINTEYAKRFEYNKKREELQKYEELKKKGVIEELDDESSESEEDNHDIMGNNKKDLDFINALLLVKKKDPTIKEKDVKLFDSESDGSEGEEEEGKSLKNGKKEKEKRKAMYLKDVMAKHLIEEGPEFQDEKEEEVSGMKKKKKSYSEEQEDIRKAFLDVVKEAEGNEEEDGFLKEKKKGDDDKEDVEDADNEKLVEKLDEYFGGDGELDENKKFLKEFFKNKMWIDKETKNKEVDDEEVEDLLREDEELQRQELYETNYRHEEELEDRIIGHSRRVEASVRKKDNARKEQRKSKEERVKIAEMERKEELKHLKNLKKKEMKERMKKVMAIAGFNDDEELALNLKDLDDEFDPEEYDEMMKAVFNEKYYDAEDVDPQFDRDREDDEGDLEKPDFDKEDELLGLPKGWGVIESGEGFKAARERSLKHKLEHGGDNDDEDEDEDEEVDGGEDDDDKEEEREGDGDGDGEEEVYEESKKKRKRKMSLVKKAKEEMLEEFYKLDYEDTIGDLKTRFKYATVKPNKYGLKTEEILMIDDKELNQYVSVKKLAPYKEKEWKVPDSKRYQQKLKNKELLQGQKSDDRKGGKKKRLKVDVEKSDSGMGAKGDEKAQQGEANADVGNLSKRAKTRRRQAKPKLSNSRLIAYGRIPSKAKSKH